MKKNKLALLLPAKLPQLTGSAWKSVKATCAPQNQSTSSFPVNYNPCNYNDGNLNLNQTSVAGPHNCVDTPQILFQSLPDLL